MSRPGSEAESASTRPVSEERAWAPTRAPPDRSASQASADQSARSTSGPRCLVLRRVEEGLRVAEFGGAQLDGVHQGTSDALGAAGGVHADPEYLGLAGRVGPEPGHGHQVLRRGFGYEEVAAGSQEGGRNIGEVGKFDGRVSAGRNATGTLSSAVQLMPPRFASGVPAWRNARAGAGTALGRRMRARGHQPEMTSVLVSLSARGCRRRRRTYIDVTI
jgi:hypothetical protein